MSPEPREMLPPTETPLPPAASAPDVSASAPDIVSVPPSVTGPVAFTVMAEKELPVGLKACGPAPLKRKRPVEEKVPPVLTKFPER